jgi:hypothetical protein
LVIHRLHTWVLGRATLLTIQVPEALHTIPVPEALHTILDLQFIPVLLIILALFTRDLVEVLAMEVLEEDLEVPLTAVLVEVLDITLVAERRWVDKTAT